MTPGYRADIDGLRALAVLAVLGFHAFPALVPGGFAGVDVFYVISGYLISGQILQDEKFRYTQFYARRIRRLFPALILVLAASLALGWFGMFASEFAQLGKHAAAGAAFVSNWIFWKEAGYFDISAQSKPLLHLWSLSVEEQFYLLWPLLLGLAMRRKHSTALIGTVLAASFASYLYWTASDAQGAFYLPMNRFWELMLGSVLARRPSIGGEAFSMSGFALILASLALGSTGAWALLPTCGALAMVAAGPKALLNRMLAWPPLVFIGLVSYPLYLWHWPLLSFARIFQSGEIGTPLTLAILAASGVLASLTYWLVERPIRRARGAMAVGALVAMVAVLGGAGYAVFRMDGVKARPQNLGQTYADDVAIPGPTVVSDGSCSVLFKLEQIRNEVCLAASAKPPVLILGDSHAMALNAAAFLHRVPTRTLVVAAYSCLPFVEYETRDVKQKPGGTICASVAHQALDFAVEHPEIGKVVLSTRGPLYFTGTGFGSENDDPARPHFTIDGDGATPAQRFERGYSRLIGELEGMGKEVIFAVDVPELGLDPHACVPGRPLTLASRTVSPCTVPRAAVDLRQAEYRAIVARLQSAHPRMKIVDPLPEFCDADLCRGKDDAHIFYYDSDHLSVAGSERVWRILGPLL